jgi:hypothetical protein
MAALKCTRCSARLGAVAGANLGRLAEAAKGIVNLVPADGINLKDLCASSEMSELGTCKIVVNLLDARAIELVFNPDEALQPSEGMNKHDGAR